MQTGPALGLERLPKLKALLFEVACDSEILRRKVIPAGHTSISCIERDLLVEQKVQIPIFNSCLEWVSMSCNQVKYLIAMATQTNKEANVGDFLGDVWFLCVADCSEHAFQTLLTSLGRLGAIRADFDQTYKLTKELGKGGYGVVYKARSIAELPSTTKCLEPSLSQFHLERNVAVKVFKAECKQIKKTVWREVRNLSLCNGHPFVTGLVGAFVERYAENDELKCFWHLATELCPLGDLFDLVQSQAPMNVDRGLNIISAVFAALGHVHSRCLVHRDVKAENIFINKGGIPVLGDFGIAVCLDDAEELAKPSGTPGYTAPEIILANRYGQKVDIFSCGVMFYFMLGKQMPFTGHDIHTIVRKTAACKVKFSHATFGHVKNSVLFILKAFLEKEEDRRPSACDAFRGTQILLGDKKDTVIFGTLETWQLKQQELEQDRVPTVLKKTNSMASRENEVTPFQTDNERLQVASKHSDEATSSKTGSFASRLRQRVSRAIFVKDADDVAGTPRSSASAVTHSSTGRRSARSKVSSSSNISQDISPLPPDDPPALLPIHVPSTPKPDGHQPLSTPRRQSFLSFRRIA